MSNPNSGPHVGGFPANGGLYGPLMLVAGALEVATLTGNKTITFGNQQLHALDPGGSSRDVTLPAIVGSEQRMTDWHAFLNTADADENLVIKKSGGSTLHTCQRGEFVLVAVDKAAGDYAVAAATGQPGADFGAAGIKSDVIAESTADAGVTSDGVLLKDGAIELADGASIKADIVAEKVADAGVTVDGLLVKDGGFVVPDGSTAQIRGAGTGTGDVVERVGGSATEGLERRVYEDTVSPVAVETNLINLPAGAKVISVQANVEVLLVAGGTSVTWSIGTAADPDKYGTSGFPTQADDLTKNSKSDFLGDSTQLTAAEQMVLTAAATGGAGDGDTAFSAGSVRVRVVYDFPNSLDDAA